MYAVKDVQINTCIVINDKVNVFIHVYFFIIFFSQFVLIAFNFSNIMNQPCKNQIVFVRYLL